MKTKNLNKLKLNKKTITNFNKLHKEEMANVKGYGGTSLGVFTCCGCNTEEYACEEDEGGTVMQ